MHNHSGKKKSNGFTLAELLIVVAIIGVLVAISIPIFTTQLEKAREAVDLSNLRSAYAAGRYKLLEDGNDTSDSGSPDYYVYDPSSGKLLTNSEAMADSDNDRFFCGKGTATVGNKDNKHTVTYNGTDYTTYDRDSQALLKAGVSGFMYDPSVDVRDDYAITVSIYPPTQTVIVCFLQW